jgi:hypothetical protein
MVLAPPLSAGPVHDWPLILYRTAGREIDTPGYFFGALAGVGWSADAALTLVTNAG